MQLETEVTDQQETSNALTCELEYWSHILDSDKVPEIGDRAKLPCCAERNVELPRHHRAAARPKP